MLAGELPVDTGCTVVNTVVDTIVLSIRFPPLVTIPTDVEREVEVIVVNAVDVERPEDEPEDEPEDDEAEFELALLLALLLLALEDEL